MTTTNNIEKVVIVGGGSAGWLTAGVLAATLRRRGLASVNVTLIESPNIATIGVGEGTWPSMRTTLQSIGISETDFIRHCDAAFKQGTCFVDWLGADRAGANAGDKAGNTVGDQGSDRDRADQYLHPFTLPQNYHERNAAADWLTKSNGLRFSDAVTAQGRLAPLGFAPKSISTPEYAFYLNYGYHLDAGKFAELLREHCVGKLGVAHRLGEVRSVRSSGEGDLLGLELDSGEYLEGDFFVDCSGMRALLLGDCLGVPLRPCGDVLFNDRALAVQVPYTDPGQAVASCTISTAREAGWIWDIGLGSRRGVGYVYSSAHSDTEAAGRALRDYLGASLGAPASSLEPREIAFTPGYREQFWRRNCLAIGMASGFIEPLEASALVLVELSARYLAEDFPVTRDLLPAASRRFNRRFRQHWEMIIDFLKLHYVLSRREGAYWRDHRAERSVPESLADRLALWRHRPPWHQDAIASDDMFPPASYQYVLYGMGYRSDVPAESGGSGARGDTFAEVQRLVGQLQGKLPAHRELLNRIREHRLPTV
ncbi:MAG: tryptophan halogenase family protein [Halieaceae bacterium]|jgi:tryptophan halogenase|nr:tryptophan halogenase family protein [Halieaceae bacterium]